VDALTQMAFERTVVAARHYEAYDWLACTSLPPQGNARNKMPDRIELAKIYVRAQADGSDESIAVLEPLLEEDILLTMALGPVPGKAAVLNQMKNPVTMHNFTIIRWDEPRPDGDLVRMTGLAPIEATLGGFNLTFEYSPGYKLDRVLMQPIPAPPMPVSELRLSEELKELVNEAPLKGLTILVAAVDLDLQPRLTLRGSLSVLSDTQVGFWARNVGGSTARSLAAHPRLTLFYRDGPNRHTLTFYGRGRVAGDEATRLTVFSQSIEAERRQDPQMKGGAIVVDLDAIEGVGPSGRVNMKRGG
jgi:hypothetical protein